MLLQHGDRAKTSKNIWSYAIKFFDNAIETFQKHLMHWNKEHKIMMLGGEHETAQIYAKWILNKHDQCDEIRKWYSPKDSVEIDISAMKKFMGFDKPFEYSNTNPHFVSFINEHHHAIYLIVNGVNLW